MSDITNDEKKFNETLKRMLKTPPKPHAVPAKPKQEVKPRPDRRVKRNPIHNG